MVSAERCEAAEALLDEGKWPDAAIVDYNLGGEEKGDAFVSRVRLANIEFDPSRRYGKARQSNTRGTLKSVCWYDRDAL